MDFSHKYLLTLHKQRVHGLNNNSLRHNEITTENNLVRYYQCSYCSKSFSHRNSVRRHQISHQKCNQVAAKNHNINDNRRAKIFACNKCKDKKYSRAEHLTRHQRIFHQGVQAGQCHFCDNKVFKDLSRHMVMIHSPQAQTKEKNCYNSKNICSGSNVIIACDLCNNDNSRRFKTYRSLLHHRKRNHETSSNTNLTISKRKMFSCTACIKQFTSKYNLKTHFKTVHQCSREFLCSDCGKSFTQLSVLQSHMSHVHV